jgi:hypothetical protein
MLWELPVSSGISYVKVQRNAEDDYSVKLYSADRLKNVTLVRYKHQMAQAMALQVAEAQIALGRCIGLDIPNVQ